MDPCNIRMMRVDASAAGLQAVCLQDEAWAFAFLVRWAVSRTCHTYGLTTSAPSVKLHTGVRPVLFGICCVPNSARLLTLPKALHASGSLCCLAPAALVRVVLAGGTTRHVTSSLARMWRYASTLPSEPSGRRPTRADGRAVRAGPTRPALHRNSSISATVISCARAGGSVSCMSGARAAWRGGVCVREWLGGERVFCSEQ
eukprot:365164-Chlamydomonas_euryale.AAC.1